MLKEPIATFGLSFEEWTPDVELRLEHYPEDWGGGYHLVLQAHFRGADYGPYGDQIIELIKNYAELTDYDSHADTETVLYSFSEETSFTDIRKAWIRILSELLEMGAILGEAEPESWSIPVPRPDTPEVAEAKNALWRAQNKQMQDERKAWDARNK